MEFLTKVAVPATDIRIDYKSKLAFFGSCFADNISAQFASRKFKVLANPFGTVYNPLSIAKQIQLIASGKIFGEEDVFQDMRLLPEKNACGNENCAASWFSWDAHGSLSGKSREECIAKLNAAADRARKFLQRANVVFITLGTAFVYFLKSEKQSHCEDARGNAQFLNKNARGNVVANCHRQDPRLFERRMISVEDAAEAIKEIAEGICKIKNDWILRRFATQDDEQVAAHKGTQSESRENCKAGSADNLKIVFTVSPLRHMSDGAHGNTLSKATLQLAIDKVIRNDVGIPTPLTSYFPSYEIVMDELRDYRFYDSDMIHLSKTAEEYIFERMAETYCNEKTREDIKQVEKFLKSANHRIQNADSPTTATFLQKLHAEAQKLESQIAGLELNV
ncbi:MAG: GSCFA domain-containing protein [Fibrobacter sp.]|uniref:GSCFA domain-containing protein n=1 Tax=Fibrobacter sp. TaxID=35828 RepID=UPI0025C00323|nr:GSCFA domain-containing protein [Fibrobacter sp.]MBQ7080443.1 GSCFA domain-containing protein [Fibrobacter sp.]